MYLRSLRYHRPGVSEKLPAGKYAAFAGSLYTMCVTASTVHTVENGSRECITQYVERRRLWKGHTAACEDVQHLQVHASRWRKLESRSHDALELRLRAEEKADTST